jgi:hypothetical protein
MNWTLQNVTYGRTELHKSPNIVRTVKSSDVPRPARRCGRNVVRCGVRVCEGCDLDRTGSGYSAVAGVGSKNIQPSGSAVSLNWRSKSGEFGSFSADRSSYIYM